MKVAAPLAGGFIATLVAPLVALYSFRKVGQLFRQSRYVLAAALGVCALVAAGFAVFQTDHESVAQPLAVDSLFVPTEPPNSPLGVARGIFPGRVVWMRDSLAARWNGSSGNWWTDANTNQTVVDSMMSASLRTLTGATTDSAAWGGLFKYFNQQHGKGSVGYQAGEKFAVKINLNQSSIYGFKNPGNMSFTSPQMVLSLVRQLVHNAGVRDSDITFYDLIRVMPEPIYAKCKGEFPGVHFMGWVDTLGREKYVRDTTLVHWAQTLSIEKDASVSAAGGNPVHLATAVTHASYLINLASFKAHRYGGVTFGAKNHFGSLSVDDDFGVPFIYAPHAAGVHAYMSVHYFSDGPYPAYTYYGRLMGTYNPLVDLMGHKDLGEKTLLFLIDALYGVQSEQDQVSANSKWVSAPFNHNWTSSMFVSQDDIALESVGLDFFRNEQSVNNKITLVYGTVDNYLHEAAQANNPPSGTVYQPSGDGVRLQSLGVHEHWNNAIDKKYSRNLGTGNGIELVSLSNSVTSVPEGTKPSEFTLQQNYPNPFNPSTTISFFMPQTKNVVLAVYDVNGREIRMLINGSQTAGNHAVRWDGSDNRGLSVSSGVYFYHMRAGDVVQSRKMLLVR